jgi:hypothetical protein
MAVHWSRAGSTWPVVVGLVAQGAWTALLVHRAGDHAWVLASVGAATAVAVLAALLDARQVLVASAAVALLVAPLTWAWAATAGTDSINPSAGAGRSGGPGGIGGRLQAGLVPPTGRERQAGSTTPPAGFGPPSGGGLGADGPGGLASGADVGTLPTWLAEHAPGSRYLIAVGGRQAGALLLAGVPGVMAMGGGFDGSDPTPSAAQLQALTSSGELRYVISGSGGRPGFGGPPGQPGGPQGDRGDDLASAVARDRETWITEHCTATTAPSALGTVYDCAPAA